MTPDSRSRRFSSVESSTGPSKTGSPGPSEGLASNHPSIIEPSMMGAASPSMGSMSIGSIIDPEMSHTYSSLPSWSSSYNVTANSDAATYSQDYGYETVQTTQPSPMYSSDGWTSPGSENLQLQTNHKQPYFPQHERPTVSYASDLQSQANSAPMAAAGIWSGSEGFLYPNDGLGIELRAHEPSPVGIIQDE